MMSHDCTAVQVTSGSQLARHPRLQGIEMKIQDTGTTVYLIHSPPTTSHICIYNIIK